MTTSDGTVGRYLGWFLVALLLGSGVIHFALTGDHFDVTWYYGMFFAVVAWLQLTAATAIILRPPSRWLLALIALGNTVVITTWVVSRTVGIPFGPESGEAEDVALADALSTGFEVAIVLLALAVLLRPALAQASLKPRLGLAAISATGLAIAVVSTMSLTPSFAAEHSHGESEEDADHAHDATEGSTDEADEHAGMTDEEMAAHGDAEGAAAHDDATGVVYEADGSRPCEEAGYANEGNAGHGHRGPVPHEFLDKATGDLFREQMTQANSVVAALPTVKDAEAAGYKAITPYVPCIAAHFINYEYLDDTFDPAKPEIVLYLGNDPDSPVVGLSYLIVQPEDEEEAMPEGFAGPNDPWHVHETLCVAVGGGIRGDETTTNEECTARGGNNIDLGNLWMNHMWNAPGWPSIWGMFSSEHPDLGGTFGDPYAEPRAEDQNDD